MIYATILHSWRGGVGEATWGRVNLRNGYLRISKPLRYRESLVVFLADFLNMKTI